MAFPTNTSLLCLLVFTVLTLHMHTIHRGADIFAVNTRAFPPIMTSAYYGQLEAFKKLRMRGSPIDELDENGKSCVFLAAEANHVSILRVSTAIVSEYLLVKYISVRRQKIK